MAGEQERRSELRHRVVVLLPIDRDEHQRVRDALPVADPNLRFATGVKTGELWQFLLWVAESDAVTARARASAVMAKAIELAGVEPSVLDRAPIEVEPYLHNLTGRPRRLSPPDGDYRTLDLGERGTLRVLYEGPMGEWIVQRDAEQAWSGRALPSVLKNVLDLPPGKEEPWVHDLIATLAGHQTPRGVRFPCACCDMLTLSEVVGRGTHHTCPVCSWEDDGVQFDDLDYEGGANRPSLRQARANYARVGSSQERFVDRSREPQPHERP